MAHVDGKVHVKKIQWHCNSLGCPVCAGHAMSRAADRVVHRLVEWWRVNPRWRRRRLKPIHVVVSPPESEWRRLAGNYPRLRDLCAEIALEAGFIGGAVIPHPFRHPSFGNEAKNEEKGDPTPDKGWVESWHFHLIGFGWIKSVFEARGWVVKNLGIRGESVDDHRLFELARYQLSHCGVNEKYHSVTWIGALSSRCYTAPPMPRAPFSKCPECGAFMYPVIHLGKSELNDKPEGCYCVDPPGWRYVSGSTRLICAPDRGELNDIYEVVRLNDG